MEIRYALDLVGAMMREGVADALGKPSDSLGRIDGRLLNGVVMIVSVVRDLAFAYRFGTGEIVDAFLIGLLIPTLIVQLIAGSLSLALIPEMLRSLGGSEHAEAADLSSSVAALALGLLCLVLIALVVNRSSVIGVLTLGFDPQRAELTSFFYIGTLPCIVIQGWSVLVGGMLNAKHRFAVAALAPVIRPLAVCMTLAVDWGPGYAPVLLSAYLIGAVAEATWITLAAVRAGISLELRWGGLTAPLRRLLNEFGMAMVGTSVLSVATLADQYFASLAGAGGVAVYSYGAKVTSFLIGAAALPLGAAVLPHFSEQVRQKKWPEFRSVLLQWGGIVVAFSVPVVALIWIYSVDLVQLLFQRGAFTTEDTQRVALVQRYLALQIPFFLCGTLFVRALTSLQRNRLVALVGAVNAIINVAGSLLLVRTLGAAGIALAATCAYVVASTLAGFFVFSFVQRSIRHATK